MCETTAIKTNGSTQRLNFMILMIVEWLWVYVCVCVCVFYILVLQKSNCFIYLLLVLERSYFAPPPPRQHIRTEGSSMKFYRIPNVECVRKDNTCITLTIDSHAIRFLLESTPPHFHVCRSFVFFFLVTRCHHPYLSLWNLTIKIRWPIKYGN